MKSSRLHKWNPDNRVQVVFTWCRRPSPQFDIYAENFKPLQPSDTHMDMLERYLYHKGVPINLSYDHHPLSSYQQSERHRH